MGFYFSLPMQNHVFDITFQGEKFCCFYVRDAEQANLIYTYLMSKEDMLFGLDTETYALDLYKHYPKAALSPHLSNIRLLQIFDGKKSFVIDCMFVPEWVDIFTPFLETRRFIAHYAKFDLSFFRKLKIEINLGCSYILSKLLFHAVYPTDLGRNAGLADMVETVFNSDILKVLQKSDWTIPELTFEQVEYAALDAVLVLKLAEALAAKISKFNLERIYTLTKAAQYPIVDIQLAGLKINQELHLKMQEYWRDELVRARKEVLELTKLDNITPHKMAGWLEKNLSPEHLAIWPRTSPKSGIGKLSTDAGTLAEFEWLPIVAPYAAFQKQSKLVSTYGTSLTELINPETKRIHANFILCGTRTGRLSCSEPNLQQLPRSPSKEEKAAGVPDIRDIFIPEEGNIFICADYSQIELRVAAEISRDSRMLSAFRDGIDLHALTAATILHKPITDVTKHDRQVAKAFNFGLLFGLGHKNFVHYAKKLYKVDISEEDSLKAINAWRELYPEYREWQLAQAKHSEGTRVAKTPCGKVRKLETDNTYGPGMNTPIQGGAAEVILAALVAVSKQFTKRGLSSTIVNCVHDEILVEAPIAEKDSAKDLLIQGMIEGYFEIFPNGITANLVSAGVGFTWGQAK